MSANIPILCEREAVSPNDLSPLYINTNVSQTRAQELATDGNTTHICKPATPYMTFLTQLTLDETATGDGISQTNDGGHHPVAKNVVSAKNKRLNYIELGGRKINLCSSSRCLVNPQDAIFPPSTVLKVQDVGDEFNGQILSHRAKDILPQLFIHGRYGQPWAWLYRSDGYPFTSEQLRMASDMHLNFGKGEVSWHPLSPEEQEEAILHRLRRHGANIQSPCQVGDCPHLPGCLGQQG